MTHLHVCHDSFICVPWLIYMCAMAHFYTIWRVRYMTWRVHIRHMNKCIDIRDMRRDAFTYVTWDVTHSHTWHEQVSQILDCLCMCIHIRHIRDMNKNRSFTTTQPQRLLIDSSLTSGQTTISYILYPKPYILNPKPLSQKPWTPNPKPRPKTR